jgi:excisionase family DNA binding protein
MTKRPKMMTVKEVADYLSLSVKTIYRLVEEGTIPAFKIGGQWRFEQNSLDDWISNRINQEIKGKKGS